MDGTKKAPEATQKGFGSLDRRKSLTGAISGSYSRDPLKVARCTDSMMSDGPPVSKLPIQESHNIRNRFKIRDLEAINIENHSFLKYKREDLAQTAHRRNSNSACDDKSLVLANAPIGNAGARNSGSLVHCSSSNVGLSSCQHNLLRRCSIGVLEAFKLCDERYSYNMSLNPKRVLTKPSKPVHNDGLDNEHHDYILYVSDMFGNEEGRRFLILDMLGHGTFGQVVKCQNVKTKESVAIKIIKNQTAYFNQSMMEVTILEMLNQKFDSSDLHHITRMKDTFIFKRHLCIVFELLSLNLFELIKQNHFKGFSHQLIRIFLSQIIEALCLLKDAKIVHCDLKPENILLKSMDSPEIKVIDFGSACHEQHTVYTYIQSRFYRSPEVLLGVPYSSSIDTWSLGCIAAELFLGLPLFPGSSNYDQISRILECVGMPPTYMIDIGKNASSFFELADEHKYRLKSREQYCRENNCIEKPSKRYFTSTKLEDIVKNYPLKTKGMTPADIEMERLHRSSFIDLLNGFLQLNPLERWSPQQAKSHPYLTGEPWTGPYSPPGQGLLSRLPPSSLQRENTPDRGQTAIKSKRAAASPTANTRPRASTINSQLYNIPPEIQRLSAAAGGAQAPPGGASQNIQEYRMMNTPDIASHTGQWSTYSFCSSGHHSSKELLHSVDEEDATKDPDILVPLQFDCQGHQKQQNVLAYTPSVRNQRTMTHSLQQRRVSNPPSLHHYPVAGGGIPPTCSLRSPGTVAASWSTGQKRPGGALGVSRQILPSTMHQSRTSDSLYQRGSVQHQHDDIFQNTQCPQYHRSVPLQATVYHQHSPFVTPERPIPGHDPCSPDALLMPIVNLDVAMADASHLSQSLPVVNFFSEGPVPQFRQPRQHGKAIKSPSHYKKKPPHS